MPTIFPEEQAARLRAAAVRAQKLRDALNQFLVVLPLYDDVEGTPTFAQLTQQSAQLNRDLERFNRWVTYDVSDNMTERKRASEREFQQIEEEALAESKGFFRDWLARQSHPRTPNAE